MCIRDSYDGEFVPNLLKPVSSQGIELIKDSLMKEYMVIKAVSYTHLWLITLLPMKVRKSQVLLNY